MRLLRPQWPQTASKLQDQNSRNHQLYVTRSGDLNSASVLAQTLRLERLYCGRSNSHEPSQLPYRGLSPNIHHCLGMAHLSKSVKFHLNMSVNFYSSHTFKNHTNSEISQNSRSIAVLLVSPVSLKANILTPKLTLTFCFATLQFLLYLGCACTAMHGLNLDVNGTFHTKSQRNFAYILLLHSTTGRLNLVIWLQKIKHFKHMQQL